MLAHKRKVDLRTTKKYYIDLLRPKQTEPMALDFPFFSGLCADFADV